MAFLQQKRKKWGVRWREIDGSERWRGCPNKETAQQLQREIEAAIALGKNWEPERPRPVFGLRDIAADWLRACQRRQLAAGTLIHYGQYIEDFAGWYEALHGPTPKQLSRRLLESYYDQLQGTGRYGGRKLTTALKYMSAIHAFWEWASRREEYREFLPPYDPVELAPRPVLAAVQAATWEEMDACLEVAPGMYPALIVLLRCTGLRVQQAMGLRWAHVDLQRGELHVPPELGKSRQEKGGRLVPLAPVLLKELRQKEIARWGEDFLVPCGTEHRIARSPKMLAIWDRVTSPQRAAIYQGHPYHAFRRGFISGLRHLGAKEDAVEFLVGHAMRGVQASYVDPRSLSLKEAVRLVPPFKIKR